MEYGSKKNGRKITSATGTAFTGKLLKISKALKNALCTNLCVREDDPAKIVDSTGRERCH